MYPYLIPLYGRVMLHCTDYCILFPIHLLLDIGCFHFFGYYERRFLNTPTQVSVSMYVFSSVGCEPRSGIAGSHRDSVFNVLSNCHTVLHSGCTLPVLDSHARE